MPVKRGTEDPAHDDDQFMPRIAVDANGVNHVIYYDDREFTQADGPNTTNAKFNVYYTWSDDGGATWHEGLLHADPNSPDFEQPVFDFARSVNEAYQLRDYIGIDWCVDPQNSPEVEVWTSFMGTSVQDTNDDQTVIWSSRINW